MRNIDGISIGSNLGCGFIFNPTIQDTLDDMAFSTSTSEQAYGWPKYAPNLSDP